MKAAGRSGTPEQLLARAIPYLLVLLLTAVSLAAPRETQRHQAWPLLLSIGVVGLPHGAGDHLVPVWAQARRLSPQYLAAFFAGYLGVAALVWALWLASPMLGVAYFLAITVWHWGSADASDALPHAIGSAEWFVRTLSRGAIIIAGPIAAHFAAACAVITSLVLAFHSSVQPSQGLRVVAEAVAEAAILAELCIAVWNREWRLLAETILLSALVVAAPPLAAIGVYFLGWHSLRHLARLTSLRTGDETWNWRQFGATYAALLPLTVAAVALLAWISAYLQAAVDQRSILAVYLILVSALTLPHALVTGWLDRLEKARR